MFVINLMLLVVAASCQDNGLPTIDEMQTNAEEFINSGISVEYVREWDLKEGIRELVQNAVDGMATFLLANGAKKSDWKIVIKEHSYESIQYRSFEFIFPVNNKEIILGRFTYNPLKQELVLENPGSLQRYNLLLGGSGEIKTENKLRVIIILGCYTTNV